MPVRPSSALPFRLSLIGARALQRFVESPLSVQLLKGAFQRGDVVLVDAREDEGITFHKQEGTSFELPVKKDAEAENE